MNYRKSTQIILSAITLSIATTGVNTYAGNESINTTASKQYYLEHSVNSSGATTSMDNKNTAEYWAQKKIEMQNKSTEMRKKKYDELKAKGIDLTSFNIDVLDATLKDEAAFWNEFKRVLELADKENRRKNLEKLTAQGIDISPFTEEVLADGTVFWATYKKVTSEAQKKNLPTKEENIYQKYPSENEKYKEMRNQKDTMKEQSQYSQEGKQEIQSKNHQPTEGMKEQGRVPNMVKPALTETARKKLIQKLKAIPEENKEQSLSVIRKNIEKQMAAAKKKQSKTLYRKLQETLAISEEILSTNLDEEDDESIIDSITTPSN